MNVRPGVLVAAAVLATGCFNPPDPPADADGTTDAGTSTGLESSSSESIGNDVSTGGSVCDPNPCDNGGECVPVGNGFTCVCPPGFMGDFCEVVDEDPCDPNPCENEGTCTVGADGAVCECAAGFEGAVCEDEIDECADMPCQNGGTCTDEVAGFSCECPSGFEGDACELNIDDCVGDPCQNGGACVDEIDGFTCNCPAGFEGGQCECMLAPATPVNYTNRGTFTAGMIYDAPPGVRVTGSNTINVLNLNGLGIVGGSNNNTIDGNEFIEFEFDFPSTATQYFVPSAGNIDGDGFVGEAIVQAFDENGMSLGSMPVNGSGNKDLNAMFGAGVRILGFRVTADVDSHRIGSVTVSPVVCM